MSLKLANLAADSKGWTVERHTLPAGWCAITKPMDTELASSLLFIFRQCMIEGEYRIAPAVLERT